VAEEDRLTCESAGAASVDASEREQVLRIPASVLHDVVRVADPWIRRRAATSRRVDGLVMIDAPNYSATETLRDGRTVEIRAQRPQDRQGMLAAIARYSTGSLYRRFFAVKREFSDKETDYFIDIDFVNHVALVAVDNDSGQPTIVGGGRYVVVQSGQAEVAFAIVDAYQRLGIGSALMSHLAVLGREAGLREFIAEVLSENVPMLNVFERSGLAMNTKREGRVVHVTLWLS
jgi:GNAT superfamily N-acetyltransferase